jgi:hypothetical protein
LEKPGCNAAAPGSREKSHDGFDGIVEHVEDGVADEATLAMDRGV